jgi:o-succinylbenzoate synthase
MIRSSLIKKVFHFNFDARTSRGNMSSKTSWFIKLWNSNSPGQIGLGECGPLPGLSPDDRTDFEYLLADSLAKFCTGPLEMNRIIECVPANLPSIRFGLETAVLDLLNGGKRLIYKNRFVEGVPVPINGLIWMSEPDSMIRQIDSKIMQGFRTIKIKVGSLDFSKECEVLQYIRTRYANYGINMRLDANGAFNPGEALDKLNELARFSVHSIEQPIKPGSTLMEQLCKQSPIPIALDEELIGVTDIQRKVDLLTRIKPHFIILKPTLHGGLNSCREWIQLTEQHNVGWWMTSALESNIGLNAICQFTANYEVDLPQGLGTGLLYQDNFPSPLTVSGGEIRYDVNKSWDLTSLEEN